MGPAAIRPIYVLHGDDGFLRDVHREEVVARVIGDADPQVAVTTFAPDAELADVLDELRTLPFLAARRAVVIRDADAFVAAHRDKLERYLDAPAPSAALVLIVSTWAANWRIARRVKLIGELIDCSVPKGGNLSAWLRKAAGKRGKRIAPDAAELLAEWVGRDLAALNAELEKLTIYVGERETITLADVSALVTATAGADAFALTNAISAGDPAAALRALDAMLAVRGDEFKTLGMLAWHLRRALQAQRDLAAGREPSVRMPYAQRSAFLGMVRRRGGTKLQGDFRRLLRADLGMKSGLEPTAALQALVVGLCS